MWKELQSTGTRRLMLKNFLGMKNRVCVVINFIVVAVD